MLAVALSALCGASPALAQTGYPPPPVNPGPPQPTFITINLGIVAPGTTVTGQACGFIGAISLNFAFNTGPLPSGVSDGTGCILFTISVDNLPGLAAMGVGEF